MRRGLLPGIWIIATALGFGFVTGQAHPEIARRIRKLTHYRTKRKRQKAEVRLARFCKSEAILALSQF